MPYGPDSGYGEGGYGAGGYGGLDLPAITISAPLSPAPQQFTTATTITGGYGAEGYGTGGYGGSMIGPTILGVIDGVNPLFSLGVYLRRAQIFRNGQSLGIGQSMTLGVDVLFSGRTIMFIGQQIPQPGDVITLIGWP